MRDELIMDLDNKPNEPGWYIVYVNIPEGGWLEPQHWNGKAWNGDMRCAKINHVYACRFENEAEAEAYGGKDLY